MSTTKPRPSCILFQSEDKTVTLVDIPRSLEEAQVLSSDQAPSGRRIRSSKPVSKPFPTPEPKDVDTLAQRHSLDPSSSLAELMTGAAVENALATLHGRHRGSYCLSRLVTAPPLLPAAELGSGDREDGKTQDGEAQGVFIPEKSHYLCGSIDDIRDDFLSSAPQFDLIVLDPPWPNRSAKRKRAGHNSDSGAYATVSGIPETRHLLSQIPVPLHLAPDGLVAIWVTNKPSLVDLLVSPRDGVLASWGLEVAAEWTWLKVTSEGQPLYDMQSTWRKPWEKLILAKRPASRIKVPSPRVLVAVPDLHSRKPNLRPLFEGNILSNRFLGLEVFARNLTAGWWGWGDEVLRFQGREYWIDDDVEEKEIENVRDKNAPSN